MKLASPAPRPTDAPLVTICGPDDQRPWNSFVASHSRGSFYHLHQWQEINRTELGHESIYLAAKVEGEIVGVLPLVSIRSRLLKNVVCSLPFVNFGGPCGVTAEVEQLLIAEAVQRTNLARADYLELRCTDSATVDLPVSLRKVSMTLQLDSNPDTVWSAFTSKHRNNIRRAYKNALRVQGGGPELLATFYSLMEQSWKSLGTPLYRRSYFQSIVDTFPDLTRIFVCYRDQEPVAAAFNGYFNGTVEGMWAGGSSAARGLDANLVLYWEMIKDACERGYSRFHLGRSTSASGGEEFKRKWNAEARQLYWYFHRPDGGPPPEINVDNPKFALAISAWKKMPLWMTRAAGPLLARLIP